MKILIVHNRYQHAGGEDTAFEMECAMLVRAGHEVITWEVHNTVINASHFFSTFRVMFQTLWNPNTSKMMRSLIHAHCPDIVHFHNTFPLISPAAYWACKKEGIPVVQTLHNYRLCCLNAYLFRDGHICEKCLGKTPWWGLRYRCYRQSLGASMTIFAMLAIHRLLGTWKHKVDAYIALTEFGKRKMVEARLPEGKIFVKPNAICGGTWHTTKGVQEFRSSEVQKEEGDEGTSNTTVLYAGRLSPEKGVPVLLKAWKLFKEKSERDNAPQRHSIPHLVIAGDGPERHSLESLAKTLGLVLAEATAFLPFSVTFAGHMTIHHLQTLMRQSRVLVVPSLCYETFGMSITESFMQGLPVIVSNTGGQATLVQEGVTGWYFNVGEEADLADKLILALTDPHCLHTMKVATREWITQSDSMESRNVCRLIDIYTECIKR